MQQNFSHTFNMDKFILNDEQNTTYLENDIKMAGDYLFKISCFEFLYFEKCRK